MLAGSASGHSSRRSLTAALDVSSGWIARAITVLAIAGAVNPQRVLTVLDATIGSDDIAEERREREEFDRSQRSAVDAYKATSPKTLDLELCLAEGHLSMSER